MQWVLIFSTRNLSEANIVKGMLEENHVQVMLFNKQDSSYLNFGEIELYVPTVFQQLAKELLGQRLLN